jgi:hypothetical protein
MARFPNRSPLSIQRYSLEFKKDDEKINEIEHTLNQEPHFFIVILGLIIGTILSIFIDYHLSPHLWSYGLLSLLPFTLAYGLRKIYIHTLIHTEIS